MISCLCRDIFFSPTIYLVFSFFFFFNDTATTEIYTLSLHDALPISPAPRRASVEGCQPKLENRIRPATRSGDRKSTRLNSSHGYISYAVFCLKKKKKKQIKKKEESSVEHSTKVRCDSIVNCPPVPVI